MKEPKADGVAIPVFIYGTLRSHSTMKDALGKVLKGKTAILEDHIEQIHVWDGDHYPTVKPAKGQVVRGELVHVTKDELKKLDQWEHLYTRQSIKTTGGQAWVYIFRHG